MAKKKYNKFTIIRDSREKSGCGWNFRASSNCEGMIIKKLDTGDYSIQGYEDLIMIERKSIADLWGSLGQWRVRFMKEMDRALEFPVRYLVIEGTIADINKGFRYSKLSSEYIFASLTSLEIKYGIHVVYTNKRQDVARAYIRKLLAKLFQYCEDGVIKKNDRKIYSK